MEAESSSSDFEGRHMCPACEKSYNSSSSLGFHIRQKHGSDSKLKSCKDLICTLCNKELVSKKELEKHIVKDHNINVEKENITFSSENDFSLWKANIEKETKALYVKNSGSKRRGDTKLTYFYCHRSGHFSSTGKGQRSLKVMGSNKINGVCPAMIKLKETNSCFIVEHVKTHIGHKNELGRMQLTEEEKNIIANKISKNIPLTNILDEIRNSVTDKLEFIHLLTRKDLLNIKQEFNINACDILSKNDAESVDIWVEKMSQTENSPVIFYKQQNLFNDCGLNENDFLLVIMNDVQKKMLNMYGNDVVCIDFTHGMNAYNFDLATLLVLDDKREGFPAAFIFSSRQDSQALKIAFSALKNNGVEIKPKIFMTDDTETFYSAFKEVFCEPGKRLLCSWHIDRAWRKKISELISEKIVQAKTYKMLRCLLSETDEEAFELMLKASIDVLQEDDATKAFSKYFVKYYAKRAASWAYCYRKWSGVNTNMHIERLHRTIKYLYLEGKKAKRLDRTIYMLMKFIRDKMFDRLIFLEKGKLTSKMTLMRQRHKKSSEMDITSVCEIDDGWNIPSQTNFGELYLIQRADGCSKECVLLCKDCNFCLHNFICTCLDNAVRWNMCKHIHLLCRKLKPTDDIDEENTNFVIDENMDKEEEKQFHLENLKQTCEKTSLVNMKEKLQKFYEDLGKDVNECNDVEEIKKLTELLETASTSFRKFKSINSIDSDFGIRPNEPANKKIKMQRFISMKN